jgi:hypothetical protein
MNSLRASLVVFILLPDIDPLQSTRKIKQKSLP